MCVNMDSADSIGLSVCWLFRDNLVEWHPAILIASDARNFRGR